MARLGWVKSKGPALMPVHPTKPLELIQMNDDVVISGHAPGHLRARFLEFLEAGEPSAELNALAARLWSCGDVVAGSDCGWLDVPVGSTYARLARRIRSAQ
jgi:hypothetical protein